MLSLVHRIIPVLQGIAPIIVHQLNGARLVFILVLLVAFLLAHISLYGRTGFFPSRDIQLAVNILRGGQSVTLKLLKLHLIEIALGDELLLLLVSTIQLCIGIENVLLHHVFIVRLELQRLDGVVEEAAGALEHSVRITHQIDELGVGEQFHQSLYTTGVWRVLGQILCAAGIPQRNLH